MNAFEKKINFKTVFFLSRVSKTKFNVFIIYSTKILFTFEKIEVQVYLIILFN